MRSKAVRITEGGDGPPSGFGLRENVHLVHFA